MTLGFNPKDYSLIPNTRFLVPVSVYLTPTFFLPSRAIHNP